MPPASRPRRPSSLAFDRPRTLMVSSAPPRGESRVRSLFATADHVVLPRGEPPMSGDNDPIHRGYTRKQIVHGAIGAGAAFTAAPLLAACGGGSFSAVVSRARRARAHKTP